MSGEDEASELRKRLKEARAEAELYLSRYEEAVQDLKRAADEVTKLREEYAKVCAANGEVGMLNLELQARILQFTTWLDLFEETTRKLPIQHEDESKGQSSFNWRIAFVREARQALGLQGGAHG